VPPFELKYLRRGHAVHFRCQASRSIADAGGCDVKMRGVDPFAKLWRRRTTIANCRTERSAICFRCPTWCRPRKPVQAGDNVWVKADILMTHDVCGPGTIGVFKREFGAKAKVWDRNKVVIIPDHYIFTADSKVQPQRGYPARFRARAEHALFLRRHRRPNGSWKFDPSKGMLQAAVRLHYAGVCHTALPQKGHTRPGRNSLRHRFPHLHGRRVQ
jgi:hypothetical protein